MVGNFPYTGRALYVRNFENFDMSKTLVIAEKPSVATDLSRVLGGMPGNAKFKKEGPKGDYFENDQYVISSAVGHLVELEMPKAQWKFESLPILPETFGIQPIEKTKDRLNLLKRLMKRKDVELIINACDAGREGELIFHYVKQICGVKKPLKRLWMQSMTNQAIQKAFGQLRDEASTVPLTNAALCRSESDWLVGINGTRAMTAFNSRNGGFRRTPVGRVQTPTLTLMVERENKIRDFVSRTYWEIYGDFDVSSGQYRGRWFNPEHKKDELDPHLKAERLWDKVQAEAIEARCAGKTGTVEEKTKPSKQAPSQLYDLTTLQREASSRFGFSARNSLAIAQALYEKHKVLTYPRTDSKCLPEDYVQQTKDIMQTFSTLGGGSGSFPPELATHAGATLTNDWVKPNKRIFNNAKVSDHFAIIPTGQVPKNLKEQEQKVYDMVTRRFIAVFFPSAEYDLTQRITTIGEDKFRTDGKVLRVPGWLAVYGKQAGQASGKEGELVAIQPGGEDAKTALIEVIEKETKPPPRYSEATLLSAMETAGKLVDDEELRSAMSERGLGTPATRAATIEGLIQDKYVNRENRELMPTQQGMQLIDLLNEIGIQVLCSPEMTGNWEHKLKEMEEGKLDRDSFMADVRKMTIEVVDKAREHAKIAKERVYPALEVPCPVCNSKPLKQDDRTYRCPLEDCKFALWKVVSQRELQPHEAIELLTTKVVGPLTGFRSRWGQLFDATLRLDKEFKVEFITQSDEEVQAERDSLIDANFVCDYPHSGDKNGKIYESPEAYVLDLAVNGDKEFRKVRLKKVQCKVELSPDEAKKFFTEGKTSLIETFISKKGRPFKAFLEMDHEGRRFVNWRFPPRAKKKTANSGSDDPKDPAGAAAAPAKKKRARKKAVARKVAAKKAS